MIKNIREYKRQEMNWYREEENTKNRRLEEPRREKNIKQKVEERITNRNKNIKKENKR